MTPSPGGAEARITLHPGDYEVSAQPVSFTTLLGSCVAVCLYDPVRGVAGMNHFLLTDRRYALQQPVLDSEAGRYGIHAMELLINALLKLGAQRRSLKAKAFGGGNVLGSSCDDPSGFPCVGTANIRFVREFLEKDGIPLVAADLGGSFGRQIAFTNLDYSVLVRKISPLKAREVVQEERIYWRDHLQGGDVNRPDYW
ncbi:chemotaxis protein CheD [Thiorhodococcus minor]|uniref:Probable chemoreceptor glutamine deamidase CheD n=2 Tax=Thiorhodococcus minor TaxID=57489 RepID=A0A6M0K589_9GAMM|nr:chemotaxis protein CheD [Thiorhodococcus minor]